MSLEGSFLFLGTGGASGTPMVGCRCSVCTSLDPCNKRLRPSGLVTIGQIKLLIDAGPDLRFQALHYKIDTLDGVLLTHSHFDHVAGLDELRAYYLIYRSSLPVFVSRPTLDDLKRRYDYLFREKSWSASLTAQLEFRVLEEERGRVYFQDIPIQFIRYEQPSMPVTGYRFGNFAYISDIRTYPETVFDDLEGVDQLILGALREEPSRMHFNFEEAVDFARRVGAQQTYLTHMSHEVEHVEINATLPKGVQLAYDGLEIDFTV